MSKPQNNNQEKVADNLIKSVASGNFSLVNSYARNKTNGVLPVIQQNFYNTPIAVLNVEYDKERLFSMNTSALDTDDAGNMTDFDPKLASLISPIVRKVMKQYFTSVSPAALKTVVNAVGCYISNSVFACSIAYTTKRVLDSSLVHDEDNLLIGGILNRYDIIALDKKADGNVIEMETWNTSAPNADISPSTIISNSKFNKDYNAGLDKLMLTPVMYETVKLLFGTFTHLRPLSADTDRYFAFWPELDEAGWDYERARVIFQNSVDNCDVLTDRFPFLVEILDLLGLRHISGDLVFDNDHETFNYFEDEKDVIKNLVDHEAAPVTGANFESLASLLSTYFAFEQDTYINNTILHYADTIEVSMASLQSFLFQKLSTISIIIGKIHKNIQGVIDKKVWRIPAISVSAAGNAFTGDRWSLINEVGKVILTTNILDSDFNVTFSAWDTPQAIDIVPSLQTYIANPGDISLMVHEANVAMLIDKKQVDYLLKRLNNKGKGNQTAVSKD